MAAKSANFLVWEPFRKKESVLSILWSSRILGEIRLKEKNDDRSLGETDSSKGGARCWKCCFNLPFGEIDHRADYLFYRTYSRLFGRTHPFTEMSEAWVH
jgi:hypothetical protein